MFARNRVTHHCDHGVPDVVGNLGHVCQTIIQKFVWVKRWQRRPKDPFVVVDVLDWCKMKSLCMVGWSAVEVENVK